MSAEVMCSEIFIQLVLYRWICLVHAVRMCNTVIVNLNIIIKRWIYEVNKIKYISRISLNIKMIIKLFIYNKCHFHSYTYTYLHNTPKLNFILHHFKIIPQVIILHNMSSDG